MTNSDDEEIVLNWKNAGDRWIAYVIRGDADVGWDGLGGAGQSDDGAIGHF